MSLICLPPLVRASPALVHQLPGWMEQGLKTQFRVSEPWALIDLKTLGFGRIPGFYKISSYPNKRKWALWFWGLILLQFSLLN